MISSKDNSKIKELKKLHQRKYRKKTQSYLIEGFHLVEEAHLYQSPIEELYVTEKFLNDGPIWLQEYTVEVVTPEVLQFISELPTPQGIVAKVKIETQSLPKNLEGNYLLLDAVQDPGNLGTMIRSADAFGMSGVILGEGTADWHQGKVLRALQGSQYHLDIYEGNLDTWIQKGKDANYQIFGTELNEEAISLDQVKLQGPFMVILGNEGQGVNPKWLQQTTQNIYITMPGKAESLNVGVACGIVLYQLTLPNF